MYKVRCNCGQNELFFKKLNASDFPNGFEDECCKQKKEQEDISVELLPETVEETEEKITKKRGRPKKAAS